MVSPSERENIIKAREALEKEKQIKEDSKKMAIKEAIDRKHGKLLTLSSYISMSVLITYSTIVFLISIGGNGESYFDTLKSLYYWVAKFLLSNLNVKPSLISILSAILTVATATILYVLSFTIKGISKLKLEHYIMKKTTIICYQIFLILCTIILFVAVIIKPNPLTIITIILLLTCVILAFFDMKKTSNYINKRGEK